MDLTLNLADNIKAAMKARGISSQVQLARKSGLSQQMINFVCNAQTSISVTRLEMIARALRVEAWQMLLPHATFMQCLSTGVDLLLPDLLALDDDQRRSVEGILRSLAASHNHE